MAKGDGRKESGWDEPPPARSEGAGRRGHFRQLSLRNLMVALVYFALVFWLYRNAVEANQLFYGILLAVLIGLGVSALGLWAALRMTRFSFLGWIIFVLGYGMVTFSTVGGFAIPTLPILIGAIVNLNLRRRSTDQEALLWVLNVAAERGIPLSPGVQAFSSQASGVFRIWTASLAELLRQGVSLPEAIESLPRIVSGPSALLIRMGAESGDLAAGLGEATRARTGRSPGIAGFGARMAYLGWVAFFGLAIVGFLMYFIIPKFEAIFRDFGVELPEVTLLVIRASHHAVDLGWLWILIALMALIYLPFAVAGWSNLGLPLVDRMFSRRHTILILRALALVISSGRPIGPAFHAMARWYPSGWVRKRLLSAAAYVDQGVDWSDALRSCGLLSRTDLALLDASHRAGNLSWTLRELAESGARRLAYRLLFWSQVVFVLSILLIGGVVFLLAVAYFMPLITLIQRLSRW
jgi:type II secretory pathway component PulF